MIRSEENATMPTPDREPEPPIDKSKWGEGPWQTEPDRVDFIAEGFACMMLRHPHHGHWCSYVGVPSDHPAYGKGYDDVDVDFHGGLTYAAKCNRAICHIPEPGMPDDVWWLGGDFAHCFDFAPGGAAVLIEIGVPARDFERGEVYRTESYVRECTVRLARELREMAGA
jgi:hypothetical protein